ncbi:hypothetical protein GCM10022243_54730 [Saccharothrix violaceirubra]|uniref:Glycopeptide antibiotics resistance protein n=1 Tax=Saccharothrix violaceirubra TaxID=413306 RepID=A0A7W7T615_9PSEU|nr:VanZ family protein [Saccharothrix violaceirubra]MBB4966986.1 glycopeptide antibiotics resistance protein [Saccharothrix violaceirubra]
MGIGIGVGTYLESVRAGFAAFVGVGALVLLPLAVLHYRRFGRVEPRRAFVLYGLLAYGLVAAALIFLPFPDPAAVCRGETMTSLRPFQWVTDMRANLSANGRSGLVAVVTSTAFLQQAFNVALFVPLGVVMRKAYGRGLLSVGCVGLGLSLAVEVVQYTGNFGVYACPYRISDVDDLISNTSGALLGWMLAPAAVVVPAVPSRTESVALPEAVSVPRRLVALAADAMVVVLAVLPDPRWAPVAALVVRVVAPAVTDGWTPGSWLVGHRLRTASGTRVPIHRLLAREVVGATGLCAYVVLVSPRWDMFAVDVAVVALVLLGAFVVPVFRRDQCGWPDLLAGTRAEHARRSLSRA